MTHETGGVPDRPGGDAESALESAARHLRATPCPIRGLSARDRDLLEGRQARDLLAWACESGCLIEAADYVGQAQRGGEEHRVWPAGDGRRVAKATYPGRYGFTVVAGAATGWLPSLTKALPLEYLERLLLQNQVFGDQVELRGVSVESEKPVILTTQPALVGRPPQLADVAAFLTRLWFRPLAGLHLGNPGALAFYRDLDELAVFDAHPVNFVQDTHGVVLPIDLILVRADAALQAAIEPFLAQA